MKASADFEEAADTSMNFGAALSGARDAGQDLQQGAFARAVASDEANDFAPLDLEIDVFERPDKTRASVGGHAGASAGVDGGGACAGIVVRGMTRAGQEAQRRAQGIADHVA